jgi:hypothetical protein
MKILKKQDKPREENMHGQPWAASKDWRIRDDRRADKKEPWAALFRSWFFPDHSDFKIFLTCTPAESLS